jgi:hypothetical protein
MPGLFRNQWSTRDSTRRPITAEPLHEDYTVRILTSARNGTQSHPHLDSCAEAAHARRGAFLVHVDNMTQWSTEGAHLVARIGSFLDGPNHAR